MFHFTIPSASPDLDSTVESCTKSSPSIPSPQSSSLSVPTEVIPYSHPSPQRSVPIPIRRHKSFFPSLLEYVSLVIPEYQSRLIIFGCCGNCTRNRSLADSPFCPMQAQQQQQCGEMRLHFRISFTSPGVPQHVSIPAGFSRHPRRPRHLRHPVQLFTPKRSIPRPGASADNVAVSLTDHCMAHVKLKLTRIHYLSVS